MKKLVAFILTSLCIISLVGCGKKAGSELSPETLDAITNLDSIQQNYSTGVAPLIEIPPVWAEELYNNYDAIVENKIDGAPISLREYAATNVVYFDYADDFSVIWDKNNGNVYVEATDTAERDDFANKQHK